MIELQSQSSNLHTSRQYGFIRLEKMANPWNIRLSKGGDARDSQSLCQGADLEDLGCTPPDIAGF